jgi:hypothetical protein
MLLPRALQMPKSLWVMEPYKSQQDAVGLGALICSERNVD